MLRYHLVVVTKYRHPVINGRIRERLLEITGETFRKWKCNVISAEGSLDASELAPYYREPFFWSRSYFLSTVSEVDDKTIRNYIENQNKDDAT